ncbi:adhesion G protein-coupled receptor B2 [Trichonephila clavipes]|nr:adhesion G protein-coupled receptor B2 [Trichonephila clavipes]
MIYGRVGSEELGETYNTLLLILAGDFNVNFTCGEGQLLVNFLQDNLVVLHFKYDLWHRTVTAGSDVVQSGRPMFDDFLQHLWPYIGNNTANVVLQMVKRLWLIRIDQ